MSGEAGWREGGGGSHSPCAGLLWVGPVAAEAGSWGGGGGTGGISTQGLGACGGPSKAEVGGPGVVAEVGAVLVELEGAGTEPEGQGERIQGEEG